MGKTTLGKRAAKKLGMSFVDVDMGFEDVEGSDIDTLLNQYGDEGFNKRILTYFATLINRADYTIFAAPARVTHYKRFWEVVKLKGISIHLRGKPMEVYCGFKGSFPRRLFLVEGIKDESDRGILRLNMKQNHGIEYCFFRTDGKREFIETAFCPQCDSNNVVFDITHDAMIKALRKINKDFLK